MAYGINSKQTSWKIVFFIVSMNSLIPCQAVLACRDSFYLIDGECKECPQTCRQCTSITTCTECKENKYGPTCQMTCKANCSHGICHKTYGYCTFGCVDGKFLSTRSDTCEPCPTNCESCSSASRCFVCQRGFFGQECLRSCPDNCADNKCDKSSGACSDCKEGYFLADRKCQRCMGGCARCDDALNCTKCQDRFYGPLAGKCVAECRKANETREFLAKPDEMCGVPSEQMQNVAHSCDKLSTCGTERFCARYCECSTDERCSAAQDGDDDCATVMLESCLTHCKASQSGDKKDIRFMCNQTCSARESKNDTFRSAFLCKNKILGNEDVISSALISTRLHCFVEESSTSEISGGKHTVIEKMNEVAMVMIVLAVSLNVLTAIFVTLMIRRHISRRWRESRQNGPTINTDIEDIALSPLDGETTPLPS